MTCDAGMTMGGDRPTGVAIYRCARCHKGHVVRLADSFFREFCDECLDYISEQLALCTEVGINQ